MRDPNDWRMEDFGPETYGDRVADVYDDWFSGESAFHVSVYRA